ncbi:MAG: hypothetical protein CFE34_11070 [Rhodobacteraceae bacterium PARR1]|nr:MAG: hypothetical protein CFE34_11070 [Rhodobacteraceae bacterium PARR1]
MRALLLGLCLLGLSGCSGWLFYPERDMLLNPAEVGLAYEDVFITAADGTRLHAWWLPAKAGVAVKGTVLHLHGNGGNVSSHLAGSWWLPAAGYQVLLLDYRGYGRSAGAASLSGSYQDIDAAFAWLQQAPEVQGRPLVLLGQSLGGAMGGKGCGDGVLFQHQPTPDIGRQHRHRLVCAGSVVGVAAIGIAPPHPGGEFGQEGIALGAGGGPVGHRIHLCVADGYLRQTAQNSTRQIGQIAKAAAAVKGGGGVIRRPGSDETGRGQDFFLSLMA